MLKILVLITVLLCLSSALPNHSKNDKWYEFLAKGLKNNRLHRMHSTPKARTSVHKLFGLKDSGIDLTDYNKILDNVAFYGNWGYQNGTSNDYFDQKRGYFAVMNPDEPDKIDLKKISLDMFIYDGKYVDQNVIAIEVDEDLANFTFNQANASLIGNNITVMVYWGYNGEYYDNNKTDQANLSIYFINRDTGKPYLNKEEIDDSLGLQIEFSTYNTTIFITTEVLGQDQVDGGQLAIYIGLMCVSGAIGLLSAGMLQKGFPNSMNNLKRISVWTLLIVNAWDFYMFIIHVVLAMDLTWWLMFVSIIYFCLAIMAEARLLFAIYFSMVDGNRDALARSCKFFSLYYILLYVLVFGYLYLTISVWVDYSSSLYLIPQIIHIIQRGRRYIFNYWLVLGFAASRLIYILYENIYPDNIFRSTPDITFAIAYTGIVALQILIIIIQRWWPRFFWTPKPYNYYVKIRDEADLRELCAICMEPLGGAGATSDEEDNDVASVNVEIKDEALDENNTKEKEEPLIGAKKKGKGVKIMQTPCKHRYHTHCLKLWMKNKLECPNDRNPIPPYNNLDVE